MIENDYLRLNSILISRKSN